MIHHPDSIVTTADLAARRGLHVLHNLKYVLVTSGKVGAADKRAAKEVLSVRLKGQEEVRKGQDETKSLAPGKAAAGLAKKNDFAAMMAARQQAMREAEEADAGMYFD